MSDPDTVELNVWRVVLYSSSAERQRNSPNGRWSGEDVSRKNLGPPSGHTPPFLLSVFPSVRELCNCTSSFEIVYNVFALQPFLTATTPLNSANDVSSGEELSRKTFGPSSGHAPPFLLTVFGPMGMGLSRQFVRMVEESIPSFWMSV